MLKTTLTEKDVESSNKKAQIAFARFSRYFLIVNYDKK